jgi:type IV pilus assembly protein PilE
MVAVAIIAILASIAWPAYKDYIMQARLTEATNALTAMQADMERYYQDNRTYVAVNTTATPPCDLVSTAGTFMLSCDTSDTAYAVQATGTGQTSGFTFTIDQTGTRATTAVPEDWGSRCSNAWIVKRGQSCT